MPVSYSPHLRLVELEKLLLNSMHYPENSEIEEYKGYWTKKELAEKISEIFDLKDQRVLSEKTIENDLKKMEEDYNAPIDKKLITLKSFENQKKTNVNKIVYFYYDYTQSIFNNTLSKENLSSLRSVIGILKQFKGFKTFEDVDVLISKLEIKATKNTHETIIFDTIDNLTGLEYIDTIATAIKSKKTLKISYQAFSDSGPKNYTIHPYQLREYNNRWFILAHTEEFSDRALGIYALDRIMQEPELLINKFIAVFNKDTAGYFKDIIGVTNYLENKVQTIKYEVFGVRAAYVITKPWHTSQMLIAENETSKIFELQVKINPELIALILQFGNDIKILEPQSLKDLIAEKLNSAAQFYKE